MTLSKTPLITILLIAFSALTADAKRLAPRPVKPVVHEGVQFRAPLAVEKMGVVQAWDRKTKEILWEKKIYEVKIDPDLEADVQWEFIRQLRIEDGALIVTTERGAKYSLNLETKEVVRAEDEKG